MRTDSDLPDPSRFRPISEGLGLNHFADGLPYTPPGTARKPMVRFQFPPPRSPRLSAEPVEAKTEAVAVTTQEATAAESSPGNAGFIARVLAFGLDELFSTALFTFIVWASFALNGYGLGELVAGKDSQNIFWPLALLLVVVQMGYFLIQETTWQRTLGKALLGIRIQSSSGFAILARAACFLLSVAPLGVGLFWYFFDSRRRCWHDVITDSEVVMN